MTEENIPLRSKSYSDDEDEYLLQYSLDRPAQMEGSQRQRSSRKGFISRFFSSIWKCCTCQFATRYHSRLIPVGQEKKDSFPKNHIKNQKYNVITFVPLVLFQQFKFFLNLYFLVMACSQFIPGIRIGYLYTYWGPLCFVILVTMIREAVDDYRRWRRDCEINSMKYKKLTPRGRVTVTSSKIHVGDLIIVEKDQRVPADLVLIRTSEKIGSCFIRTDQLDGETDWKLRLAVASTQALETEDNLFGIHANVYAEKPQRDIHSFIGTYSQSVPSSTEEPLSIENTLWCNTVVASGTAVGLVIYTGRETRSAMNNSEPRSKVGLLDMEVNQLTKVLFAAVMTLAVLMMCLKGFEGPWYRYLFRFVLLFSYLIPISLRVNLDMGKAFYTWSIQRDKKIPDTVVRSTTIAEELGRISYLLSDKTGTLTQNVMHFRKLHLGTVSYSNETFDEVASQLQQYYNQPTTPTHSHALSTKMRRTIITRVADAVRAIALCHNVTPVYEEADEDIIVDLELETEADQHRKQNVTYQAASPDEVALVSWTESVGMTLVSRSLTTLVLKNPSDRVEQYTILQVFPFTSETKRMGIIVRDEATGEITFYMKGADTAMSKLVEYNDWLEEETGNMAREGLRTLVVAKRSLTEEEYADFETRYNAAKLAVVDRNARQASVVETLERNLELLCLTGVEDKLQENVRSTLELLRNAGIKVWMLTGDKLETATCIAKSSRLVSRTQAIHTFADVSTRAEAHQELNAFRRKQDCALVIQGQSLEYYEVEFIELASACPSVVCCRCSPTQKALIVQLIHKHTGKRTAAIGDGGNDVSMIQAADAGIGIVGKEGRQAALAADFALSQFSHIGRLLLVHGRRSYKRSAALSQFVIHRGLIISTMQAVFSAIFYFASVALYQGFLMVGFSTVYTMLPVFSLVLDKDVSSSVAMTYPEIYRELSKGRSLSFKTFFIWVLISIYQGAVIMYGALILFDEELIHIVAITFSALILTELIMVGLAAKTFHPLMLGAELISLLLYVASLVIFKESFESGRDMTYRGKTRYLDFGALQDPTDRFQLGEVIGVGTYGEVYEATDKANGNRKVAIKVLERLESHLVELEEEYRTLKDLSNHPNFPAFYGAFLKEGSSSEEDQLWFAMELCGGGPVTDLVRSMISRDMKMKEGHIAYILRETIKGLQHLHMNHVIHRDVKGANILLTSGGEVKIVDFGVSRHLKKTMDRRNTAVGTPYWMAPEVIACEQKPDEGYDNRVDVWSLGITAIELGDGAPPLLDVHPARAMFQIVHNPPPQLNTWIERSAEYNDFISECLVKNPEHRPVIMEMNEHPFIQQVPENENVLKSEIKVLLEDAKRGTTASKIQEVTMKAGYMKVDRKSQLQRIYYDDLCNLERPDDESVVDQLQHRFFAGQTFTFIGDVLISVNPHGDKKQLKEEDHERYKSKSRSDEAPHVFAVADRAWQDMMHHKEHQNIVFTGESFAGKSHCFDLAMEHLLSIAKSNPGIVQKIRSASRIIDMFANAPTASNENATRHMKFFELTFTKTGKISGALIWTYMLERWRTTNFDIMHNGNFHILYYLYHGMEAQGQLPQFFLESNRRYRYLPETKYTDESKYRAGFFEYEANMKHFDFIKSEYDFVLNTLAAIILVGEIEFVAGEPVEVEDIGLLENISKLLRLDVKKFEWVLANYCVLVNGEPVKRRYTLEEAYATRDAIAQLLYGRLFDWMVNALNLKISVTRLVFGDPHAIGLLDLFGFECTESNSYEQLVVNTANEQLMYHFNQSTFGWEMQDCKQDDIGDSTYTFFDNRPILDTLLMKPEGVLAFLDEESKAVGSASSFVGVLNQFLRSKYLDIKSDTEFSIAHYTGRVKYSAEDFVAKNRNFVPPEIVELLRLSKDPVVATIYKTKMTKTGQATAPGSSQEKTLIRRFNTMSKGKFSQVRQMQTQNQVFRHCLIEVLQRLVSGASHYIRCVRPNSNGSPDHFDREMVYHQMKALGIVDTIKLRQRGFSCRVNFKEFLRRYQFLAFDFDENVEVTPDNCRILLLRLKLDGWAIGKNKIFLRYYTEEYLSRMYETQVKKIVKIQAMMRSFLARKRKQRNSRDVKVVKSGGFSQERRRSSIKSPDGFTKEEAAVEIQRNFRGYQARKEYKPLADKTRFKSATIEEEAANIIQYFFRKWRTRTIFQQLMLYRQEKQQALIYFCQQVHIYNQEACGNLRKLTADIAISRVRPVGRGTHKDVFKPPVPKVNKLPFSNKNLYFMDTSFMCLNAFKNAGNQKEIKLGNIRSNSLEWDEPMQKKSPFPKRSENHVYSENRRNEGPVRPYSVSPTYNRFAGSGPPAKTQSFIPSPSATSSIVSPKSPVVSYGQYKERAGYDKLKTARQDSSDEEKQSQRPRNGSAPNHIQELRDRAASVEDTAEDAPFNFQAMLKKTSYSRGSMKRNAPQPPREFQQRPSSLLSPDDIPRRHQPTRSTPKSSPLTPSRMELAPGLVIEGTAEEL